MNKYIRKNIANKNQKRFMLRFLAIYFAIAVIIILPGNRVYASDTIYTPDRDMITTISGDGTPGFSGDGGPAKLAEMGSVARIAVDNSGNLYLADYTNKCVRMIDTGGIINTFAGNGTESLSYGNLATESGMPRPFGVALDTLGNVYIASSSGHEVFKINSSQKIEKFAGGNGAGYTGDGGLAINSQLNNPTYVTADSENNIYIADAGNNRIRKVNVTTGKISTVVGNGMPGYTGDGGPAANSELNTPISVAVDRNGNLYINDKSNYRIRKVDGTTGIINTVAGDGYNDYHGDGGPATFAGFEYPNGIALDSKGSLYITDHDRIRKVDANGNISTVADSATAGLIEPHDVTVDSSGDLYITDSGDFKIKKLTFGRLISGNAGVAGATLSYSDDTLKTVTTDSSGNYSIKVPYHWSGTVTVSKPGYTFATDHKSYSNVDIDQTAQNYTANAVNYSILIAPVSGGSITVSMTTAMPGSMVSLVIVPEVGKRLKAGSLKYNDGMIDMPITGTSFMMPAANVTVTAEFEDIPSSGGNPSGGNPSGGNSSGSNPSGGNSTGSISTGGNSSGGNPSGGNPTGSISTGGNTGGSVSGGDIDGGSATAADKKLPQIQGSDTLGWESISEYIAKLNHGNVTIDMNDSTIVKKEILEAIRGKSITVTFILKNDLEWIINGKDILDHSQEFSTKDIDLHLSLNTENIPHKLIDSLTEKDGLQLSLNYNGSFGFTATLKLPLNKENSGRYANLFYYNPVTNTLELQSVGLIGEDGKAELKFNHASDYLVIINDKAMLEQAINKVTVTTLKKTFYLGDNKHKYFILDTVTPQVIKEAVKDGLCKMSIQYKSDHPKVASVSETGKISAKKVGKSTITTTITVNGVKKCFRTVIRIKTEKTQTL